MISKEKLVSFSKSGPLKFLLGGVVLKGFSFGANFILVDFLNIQYDFSYFLALVLDLLVGYLINRYFVFSESNQGFKGKVLFKFFTAGILFRGLNWCLYVFLLKQIELYYLLVQAIATGIVLVFKYVVYKRIFASN